ncbi:MAG: fatty acid desaturase [Silicimonas sp.]|nr:fatty acid desaturase [Silicimonas sp.]
MQPHDWSRVLAAYRTPILSRALFELTVTLIPFVTLSALAWAALYLSTVLAIGLALINAFFLLRLFMIQHDCGHGSFLRNRKASDWIGRVLGVLTLTPYDVWRQNHATHHATSGNLDRRGTGDIPTLTVREYRARSRFGRLRYRVLRNPLFLFGLAPIYIFFLQNRLPVGLMRAGRRYWLSALGTNAAIASLLAVLYQFGGAEVLIFVFMPTTLLAASIGMWLFYVQHQFEDTAWEHDSDWNVQTAAIEGSSFYDLPPVLAWLTADIGAHHVHHLASRIPFYRLRQVLRDHEVLKDCGRVTLRESFRSARLHLWDEAEQRLVSFSRARAAPA